MSVSAPGKGPFLAAGIPDPLCEQAATALAAVVAENARLRELLQAVMAEEMIYTGGITETLEASEMYPELVTKIRAALAQEPKP